MASTAPFAAAVGASTSRAAAAVRCGLPLPQRFHRSRRATNGALARAGGPDDQAAAARPFGSGSRHPLVLAEHEDAVDDIHAQEEDPERPPRVGATDRQQCADRAEAAADDSNDPAERVARDERKASAELNHTEDDQDPTQGVEVGEDVPLVVGEDV